MHSEKSSRMRGIIVVLAGVILSGFLLLPGCGGTSVETGGDVRVGYAWDTLRARMEHPIDEVYRAAGDAVHQLHLEVLRHGHDGVAGEISIVDAQREDITVDLVAMPRGRTYLTIRAGVFGNKNKAEVIFERLLENLREEPSVAKQ